MIFGSPTYLATGSNFGMKYDFNKNPNDAFQSFALSKYFLV